MLITPQNKKLSITHLLQSALFLTQQPSCLTVVQNVLIVCPSQHHVYIKQMVKSLVQTYIYPYFTHMLPTQCTN